MIFSRFLILIAIFFSGVHPVHMALTTIELDENANQMNILFKFDFESFNYIILHNYLYKLKLDSCNIAEKDKTFINDYINTHFNIKLNDNEIKISLNSHELKDNEISLYYNAEIKCPVDSILVRNLLLLDVNLNQTNLLIIKTSNFEKGYILNKDENIINISLSSQNNEI